MRPERPARPPLASIQAALLSRITGLSLGAPANDAVSLVRGDARASAEERLAVYEFMCRARFGEALASQFPRLAAGLGAEAFADLVADYLADRPSRHPSLREIGRHLPDWLAATRAERPAVAALAALEWARTDVFDLADENVTTLESLRAFPPERFAELPLTLIAAHRFVEVGGGTEALWDGLGAGAPVELDTSFAEATGAVLLVWRQDIAVYHRAVAPDEREALALVAAGTQFGVVCERLAAVHGEETAAARAFAWLSTWIADGLLAA
jgi:Putative DNA-binding domain